MAGTYNIGDTGIKGFDEVIRNLNAEIEQIKERSMKGLIKSAIIIRRDMDRTPPLIPVDKGNLRASWFVVTTKGLESAKPAFKGVTNSVTQKLNDSYDQAVAEAQGMAAGKTSFIVIGFGANYASPVHEMIGDINWNRPNSGPKFFEAAIKRNSAKIVETIKNNAQIK
jgi:hypothetical protein